MLRSLLASVQEIISQAGPESAEVYEYKYNYIMDEGPIKSVRWVGSSRKDIRSFPLRVRRDIG